MPLVRLFLILLLCVALPFNNVAAATMVHCAQNDGTQQANVVDHTDHAGQQARHDTTHDHGKLQSDHAQHDASDQDDIACSHCSYCQACASAIASQPLKPLRTDAPAKEIFLLAEQVTQFFHEQPFRPPRSAFV